MIVGWLALLAAVGLGSTTTDKQGALEAIAQQPLGTVLLWLVAVGLLAYAAWSLVSATFDTERRGHDAGGLPARAGYAVAGVSHAGLALAAAHLALGSETAGPKLGCVNPGLDGASPKRAAWTAAGDGSWRCLCRHCRGGVRQGVDGQLSR